MHIRDEDTLDLIVLKYIFSELVFQPVDALIGLVDGGKLSMSAGHCAVLSILNSVPEFVARCHGENGKRPTVAEWAIKGKCYLYVYGIHKLGLLIGVDTPLSFLDCAVFLYNTLRGEIAHAIVSGRIQFCRVQQGELMSFSYYVKDPENGCVKQNISEIASFVCYVPTWYTKLKNGVMNYIAQIELGEEELHLENANRRAWESPGFTAWVTELRGHLFFIEKVKEYWPDHPLNR